MKITKPALIVNKDRVLRNIKRMKQKVENSPGRIRFRPHFKTHQSSLIGQWFRDLGITAIAVSSVDMAFYFAQDHWQDITIAVLVNPLQIDVINRLVKTCAVDLNLVVDSRDMVLFLNKELKHPVRLWIKIDTGYHRTGIQWDRKEKILHLVKEIKLSPRLRFQGLLTHSGHSYKAVSTREINDIYCDTVSKMSAIKGYLGERGISDVEISLGDTPTCSVVEEFYGIDEVRCGNFVFYDLMQFFLGACKEEDLAVAAACPVIARYPERKEIVIYGGAVHLSKEFLIGKNQQPLFGLVALPGSDYRDWRDWGPISQETYVSSLSQEHGIIKTTDTLIKQINVGDILMILPVHSCLTANLLKEPPSINASGGQEPFCKRVPGPPKTFY
jgi:D-serine deaminase-like pyridoxal phosphate-dependent protein